MNKRIVIIVLAALLLAAGAFVIVNMSAVQTEDPQTQATQAPVLTEETADTQALDAQTAEGEEETQIVEITGEVIETGEEYFILKDDVLGEVQVNYGDDTMFDGIEMDEFSTSQYAVVLYDGKMTRSLPPQIYALRVGVYAVRGEVTQVSEEGITIVREEIGDEVIVFLQHGTEGIAVGDRVSAYTNGAMTMSLPAQTTALGIVIE